MRVFVAGGTGQLGLAAIPALVAAGHQVRATARGPEKSGEVLRLGAEPAEVDVFDAEALRGAVRGFDAVLRLTTKIPAMGEMRNPRSWEANNRLRTEGARALVDAALAEGVGRYISESVTFLYAGGGDDWIDEDAPIELGVPVLEAARTSELEAARFAAGGGSAVVLRFGSFYSATSPQTLETARLVRRRMFPVVGRGDGYFASVAVADAGAAVAAALEVGGGTYNVVDDEPLRYREYVETIARVVGGPRPLRAPGFSAGLVLGDVGSFLFRSSRVANGRLKEASAWRPRFPTLEMGLAEIRPSLLTE